ncbi:MAG: hypothetical protein Q7T42_11565 [Methylotenera sp.]|uniref:hypothetical protein n=1 Tax=Methylotenera sp. TaxID=2051956 RepID=UPI0027196E71|nr:hypothetical protein [Methylotenera sp.]MDO9394598.1 hypothetical protein [Methylotenera sp.]MDP1522844.1 hypothetical protein [Methylotenera sp.]
MANLLHEDGLGGKGLSVNSFAERSGMSTMYVRKLCRDGKIFGARLHTKTRQWWIYPPAKLLCEPRKSRGNTSTPMRSTSLDVKQA